MFAKFIEPDGTGSLYAVTIAGTTRANVSGSVLFSVQLIHALPLPIIEVVSDGAVLPVVGAIAVHVGVAEGIVPVAGAMSDGVSDVSPLIVPDDISV